MKIGRNDPCHCGSGKKYKKCHLPADEATESAAYAAKAAEAAAKAEAAAAAEKDAEKDAEKENPSTPMENAKKVAAARNQVAAPKPKGGAGPQPSPIRRKAV